MEQIDKLTQLLCLACKLLLPLARQQQGKPVTMPTKWRKAVQDLLNWYAGHRKLDKQRALKEAIAVDEEIAEQIAKIRSLGGLPSKALLTKKIKARTRVIDIKTSNAADTELY